MSMKFWQPKPIWQGQTAFIIGGGTSLADFDWSLLHGRHCIGCNDAYMLGDWVEVCYFGDYGWFKIHWKDELRLPDWSLKPGLRRFPGLKVTCTPQCLGADENVHVLEKRPAGLYAAPKIGWNCNTGASAINLALIFGAKRVVLLGFDMALGKNGDANWHPNLKNPPNAKAYAKFARFYPEIVSDWKRDWADREIINAGPVNSPIMADFFPFRTIQQCLIEEPQP